MPGHNTFETSDFAYPHFSSETVVMRCSVPQLFIEEIIHKHEINDFIFFSAKIFSFPAY